MTTLTLDGLNEEEFRRSIEMRLRHDLAGAAVERLRGLIAPYAAPGGILPQRFATVSARDLNLYGWDGLADALRRHDRPGRPVTAISIAFGWPGEDAPQPGDDGRLTPLVETAYYTDDSFPFSASSREDLLDGYSFHGCTWADDGQATEQTVSVGGIDDLHGALALLEARLLASDEPDPDDIRAGSLGACLLSVLLHQAVADRIASDGLPRPLCVMAGSNGVYPYFDAPVVGLSADALKAAEAAEEEEAFDAGVPGPRYSSLLVAGIPRAKKRAVLVLEESAEEMAVRLANLRGGVADQPPVAPALPEAAQDSAPEPDRSPDTTIIPMIDGPLMTKKTPGHAWDFRDMLGPPPEDNAGDAQPPASEAARPPVPDLPFETADHGASDPGDPEDPFVPPGEPEPDLPEPDSPDQPAADAPAPAPLPADNPAPAPRRRFPASLPVAAAENTAAAPGFALLDPAVRDRLDALLAPQGPSLRPVEPAPAVPAGREPAHGAAQGRSWPLGANWLREEEAALAAEESTPERVFELETVLEEPLPRPTLWQRLRAFVFRR